MRILTVCPGWRVFGAETITLRMLEALRDRGHDQLVITSRWSDGEISRLVDGLGIKRIETPFSTFVASLSPRYWWWNLLVLLNLPVLIFHWLTALRTFVPDVIVWTSIKQPIMLLPFLGKTPSILIEFTSTGAECGAGPLSAAFRNLGRRFAATIAVSESMRTQLQSRGVPAEKIQVVRSGAYFQHQLDELPQVDLPFPEGRRPRIGIAGQVRPEKGHHVLLEASSLLRDRGIAHEVHVFGTGDELYIQSLHDRIAELELEHSWIWHGFVKDRDQIFTSIDLAVVPSQFDDPFPTTAMDGGAYGLPVIASDRGGLPEIVLDGETGRIVPFDSPEAFADAIAALCTDVECARSMGRSGRERVFAEFTVERMTDRMEQIFSDSIAETHPNKKPLS